MPIYMKKAISSLIATATVTLMYVIKKDEQLRQYEQLDQGEEL
ncbi:hypothetical protein [Terribacillus sp. AE2B 122]|nr:hypothetical protein [Terribacillus sp. AE2B 122]